MAQLLELDTDGGGSVLVEVSEPPRTTVTRGGRQAELVSKAGESLEDVMSRLGPTVRGLVAQLRPAGPDGPSEVEVEFAIKLSSDANLIIARAGGEANFRVVLRWTRAV